MPTFVRCKLIGAACLQKALLLSCETSVEIKAIRTKGKKVPFPKLGGVASQGGERQSTIKNRLTG